MTLNKKAFEKVLTANDTGQSGSHQAGVLIPKSDAELHAFLPELDPAVKNPSTWITFTGRDGTCWRFRYIYYNNKLHEKTGTRNEYRITGMTRFFKETRAVAGDVLRISGTPTELDIEVVPSSSVELVNENKVAEAAPRRIKLRGWRRVH